MFLLDHLYAVQAVVPPAKSELEAFPARQAPPLVWPNALRLQARWDASLESMKTQEGG